MAIEGEDFRQSESPHGHEGGGVHVAEVMVVILNEQVLGRLLPWFCDEDALNRRTLSGPLQELPGCAEAEAYAEQGVRLPYYMVGGEELAILLGQTLQEARGG